MSTMTIRDGPKIVGHIDLNLDGDIAEIVGLDVLPAYRRRGHGRCLMQRALAVATRLGCSGIELEVNKRNRPALALYRSLGFQEVERYGLVIHMQRSLAEGG